MTSTPRYARAAVAAPHSLAAQAGRDILAEGGSALEAMIAMAATIAVVYPHMNAIGGDGFWLVREPGGKVHYIEACGFAGAGATIERYSKAGYDAIPARGPEAAVTVPGAIGGWALAHEMAQAFGGRLPMTDILHAAIKLARDGYLQSPSEAGGAPKEFANLVSAPGFAETFLIDGKLPAAGVLRKAERLAATLEHLAHDGLDDFYRGDIGREMAADMDKLGTPLTRADLEKFRAVLRQSLSIRVRDASYFNAPPPTQGLASLLILGIFERLGVTRRDSFEHIHGLIESTKRAFLIRDRVCTDYEHLDADPASHLAAENLARQAAAISMSRAAPWPAPPGEGDTVWMGAIDAKGLAVSYIQSIYWEYGSGCVLPKTGVLLQNRGTSFSLDPRARNPLAPGRRPFHTLNPAMAVYDDGRVMVYGSMGGDGQPQFQAQVLTRWEMGMGLAEAIDAPRFLLGRTWGEVETALRIEDRFDPTLVRKLEKAGHAVVVDSPYSETLGHAGGVVRYRDGKLDAAHDPRSDGGANGF
ncbi:MAG: gamma-glutamyltranspeptidase [Hyphomicrobiales bacterium]|nr:gamma-glutamyltranspeptidase [Hyphomicrobiales bacterium]